MEIDPDLLRQLLPTFKAELDDRSQAIVDGLLALENAKQAGARKPILDTIFRAAHNIKGAARGVELNELSDIAHALEDLFSRFRQGELEPVPALVSQCLEAVDRLRDAAADLLAERPIGFDIAQFVGQLAACGSPVPSKPSATAKSRRAKPAPAKPRRVARKRKSAPARQAAKTRSTEPKVAGGQTAIPTPPAPKPIPVVAPTPKSAKVETGRVPVPTGAGLAGKTAELSSSTSASPTPAASEIIRVGVDKLEAIGAVGEELQLTRLQIEDQYAAIQRLHQAATLLTRDWQFGLTQLAHAVPGANEQVRSLRQTLESTRNLVTELRHIERDVRAGAAQFGLQQTALIDRIRMLRLVPAAMLLRPLARSVRDISRELHKDIEFKIEGDQVELDRSVLDAIRDPMIHLVRNAIDHGIEDEATRKSAGKPALGSLNITVSRHGSEIHIEVADDGGGIHPDQLRHSALQKEIFTEAELNAMSEAEILDLVFRPGFSSKQKVTTVSGRGVGLDVVRFNLRQLKGDVHIETAIGQGTRFLLRVPLTLATDQGLFVRCGSQQYALPTTSVDRVLAVKIDDIVAVEGSQAILIDRNPVPLRSLSQTLGAKAEDDTQADALNIVVVARSLERIGFVVDEIVGEREIVIRPLQTLLHRVRFVAGATMTGSGQIIVVLNPDDLLANALQKAGRSDVIDTHAPQQKAATRILVVDDSITTRTLVKGILQSQGFEVISAVDGREAFARLEAAPVDLVVTDIEMPEMDGFELTEKIRADERFERLPVVIVTSLARDEDRQRGMAAGADAFIVKGVFETQSLLDVIRQLVED